jgi:glutamate racemase
MIPNMIGIFDSGYGGLTILRALTERLPQYSYIYYGDNANAPYGDRSREEILQLTWEGVEWLFTHGAHLVILGCNTASALALRDIQQHILPKTHPEKRVLGIVVPTIEQITGLPWNDDANTPRSLDSSAVGVLGTNATVRSNVYVHEIHARAPHITVFQQACPKLAEAIEQDAAENIITEYARGCVDSLLQTAGHMDAVLLGCTHYELIAPIIQSLLPNQTRLYEQPAIVAMSTMNYLQNHPDLEQRVAQGAKRYFFTTGDRHTVEQKSSRYFGSPVHFTRI